MLAMPILEFLALVDCEFGKRSTAPASEFVEEERRMSGSTLEQMER